METWKQVVGWPEYEVSDHGRVRRVATGRVQKAQRAKTGGYALVKLSARGLTKTCKVHVLVAYAFLGAPPGRHGQGRDDYQVNHKDGDKWHNRPENLEWIHPGENCRHAYATGIVRKARGERSHSAKLSDEKVVELRRLWDTGEVTNTRELGRMFGISRSQTYNLVKRLQRSDRVEALR